MGPLPSSAPAQPLVQPIPTMGQQIASPPMSVPSGMSPELAAIFQQMAQPKPQGNTAGLTANMLTQAILEAKYKAAQRAGWQPQQDGQGLAQGGQWQNGFGRLGNWLGVAPGQLDPLSPAAGAAGGGVGPLPPFPQGGFGG